MAQLENQALALVANLYDAALGSSRWSGAMQAIANAVHADSAMLRRVEVQKPSVVHFHSHGYDASAVDAYTRYYHRLDPFQAHFAVAQVGKAYRAERLVDQPKYRRSEWYNDYVVPSDKIHVIGALLARDSESMLQTGFQRGGKRIGFSDEEFALLEKVLPHVARAVQMHLRLAQAKDYETLVCASLDRLRIGVILTDSAARPFFVNRAAEALQGRCGLKLGPGALALASPSDTGRLQGMVAAAALTAIGDGLDGEGEARFGQGNDTLCVWVAPLARDRVAPELAAPAACAAVFVSARDGTGAPWKRLAASYGLTPAETRLARAIAEGQSVKEIAREFDISPNTVRSQLRAVFSKTGVRRQAELVNVLNNSLLVTGQ